MILLKVAWRNILRGARRSAIVVASIAIGLAACLFLVAWTKGMIFQMGEVAIRTQLGHIAIQAEGYQQNPDLIRTLPESGRGLVALAGSREGVAVSARLVGGGLAQTARKAVRVVLVGVDPPAEARVSVIADQLVEGHFLGLGEPPRRERVAPIVIGLRMAERLQVGLGDKLVVRVAGEAGLAAFRVRGIYRTASTGFDELYAYLRLPDAQALFQKPERVTEVTLRLAEAGSGPELQSWLEDATGGVYAGGPIEILRWSERAPRLAAMLDVASSMGWIFYAVIFVAMAFGVANVLLMAVFERMRELGVLRSLGLGPGRLIRMILLESVLLTGVGTLLGLGVGVACMAWLGRVGLDLSAWSAALEGYGIGAVIFPVLETNDLFAPLLLAVGTALLAALWPALRAARLQPAEAIRHQ